MEKSYERSSEDGWIQLIPFDKSDRRSMWVRISKDVIEFCAGREGDDSYVKLNLSTQNNKNSLVSLKEVIDTGIYAYDIDSMEE